MKTQIALCKFVLPALAILSVVGRSDGQTTPISATVQLPTFHRFSVTTTAIVPNRGGVYLGGVNRSSRTQQRFGLPLGGQLPGNQAAAHASSAAGLSVSATIIDHNALDRALLAEAARRRGAKFDVLGRPVAGAPTQLPATMSGSTRSRWTKSVRSNLPSRRAIGSGPTAEAGRAATYMRRGRQAEADDQPHAAKIFYQRAAKHGDESIRSLAAERLAHIESAVTSTRTARL